MCHASEKKQVLRRTTEGARHVPCAKSRKKKLILRTTTEGDRLPVRIAELLLEDKEFQAEKQTETNRNKPKQTETNRNKPKQIETNRNKQKQTETMFQHITAMNP